ncbi:ABC transporter ATP-binding protein [Beduini massiliensis]|uniref:ABC transporter ATP-binding protein n=1 Tax=Beduini massiliensis TaxID=1585974 RepID=UPI00059A92DA|nr:ATP-binding cassette domain-containing protein [Beduini massiliensis]
MADIIIKTEGLTKDYGQGRGIFDIDIEVHKGEVFGFVGTNGSGKTTTIRNMMGFIKPNRGTSIINNLDSWKQSADIMKNVSYVPGEIAFPALKTGTEFLKTQAGYLGVTDFRYMNHVIELLQLDPTANLKRMSKGMKQKTAIVAALMGEKEVLVLDEPTTGLDPLMREAFLDLIREEKQKGHTIFMSSHIFEEIEAVCDRVAMIKDGHIINTISLHDLRHPVIKNFIIEFENTSDKQHFIDNTDFLIENEELNHCTVQCNIDQLDAFFNVLKHYKIMNFQEIHRSLQEQFMSAYKEGLTKHGTK